MKGAYSGDTSDPRARRLRQHENGDLAQQDRFKTRLLSLDDLDGRTNCAKKAAQLVSGLESDLGGADQVSISQRELIKRAALLGAITEDAEVRWLRKEPVDMGIYLAAINTQRRVLTTLGLDRRARECGSAIQSDQAKLDRILGYCEEAAS